MEDGAHGQRVTDAGILAGLSPPLLGRQNPDLVPNSRECRGPGDGSCFTNGLVSLLPDSLFPCLSCSSRWPVTHFQAMKYKGKSVGRE